jgi:hypothetical protein
MIKHKKNYKKMTNCASSGFFRLSLPAFAQRRRRDGCVFTLSVDFTALWILGLEIPKLTHGAPNSNELSIF